ncbi:ATP-binding protein [Neobacillus sp. LXY-4]|uniref:sensor histidine kinase n=1 Tax=Neobacillus sp. LXY-4 TaxID=3379826 RepID=UPI003EDF6E46
MQSIRKRLSILFVACSIASILLVTIFVNITINNKFNQYMENIQDKRYDRIVSYFAEAYKKDGKWNHDTGIELMHEAYMGNYCLTLKDDDKKVVWGMNPEELTTREHLSSMFMQENGVYNTKDFEIKSDGKVVGYVEVGQYSSVLLSEEDVNFKTSINKSLVASGALTLIITVILSLYYSKQFSNPIREVANMSVNLSQGNFDTKSSTESNIEELDNLRKSINILAEKLKYQDSLRKKLVSDISHEIRTPLNVLQNNLEAMIDGVFPVTTERLNHLNEEVIRFGRLINNLNVLKEFESESIKLIYEKIRLDQFITDICKDFYMAAENKSIKLEYYIEPDVDYAITGDKDKLKQVFINLLSNSLKFTPKNGTIIINLYADNHTIVAEVKDNGVGINKQDLPFIFERLYRGDKSRNQIEGTGIGLTIVKNIIDLHNAKIDVDSTEGKGTTVKIYFDKNRNN